MYSDVSTKRICQWLNERCEKNHKSRIKDIDFLAHTTRWASVPQTEMQKASWELSWEKKEEGQNSVWLCMVSVKSFIEIQKDMSSRLLNFRGEVQTENVSFNHMTGDPSGSEYEQQKRFSDWDIPDLEIYIKGRGISKIYGKGISTKVGGNLRKYYQYFKTLLSTMSNATNTSNEMRMKHWLLYLMTLTNDFVVEW